MHSNVWRRSPSGSNPFTGLGWTLSILALLAGCGGAGSGSGAGGGSGPGGGGGTPSAPAVTSISPASVTAGSSPVTLTVNGSGFTSSSVVQVGGAAEVTTYGSASQLTAAVPATQLGNGGELPVTVVNGTLSSTGAPVNLEVDNPVPIIAALLPARAAAGFSPGPITVSGTGFDPSTVIDVNGSPRQTSFDSSTAVTVMPTTADLAAAGSLALTAVNPAPGGGTSTAVSLTVFLPSAAIYSVSPNPLYVGSPDTTITVSGAGFTAGSVVAWNGTPLATVSQTQTPVNGLATIAATVPASDMVSAGSALVTVQTPGSNDSNAVSVSIVDTPAPTLTGMSPNAGPINTAAQVTIQGTGITPRTQVLVNGAAVPAIYVSSTGITATIPASSLAVPGNVSVMLTTSAPGGGSSTSQPFTVYLPITARDIAFNSADGLLYASVPGASPGASGNSVVGIDPATGNVMRQIFVGSNPNKLALSSDGTQLFVGVDGAASVAQVSLTEGKVVAQIPLGGGEGIYNPPLTALYLAAVPGSPNSVAVATEAGLGQTGSGITIYDSGVARATSWTSGEGPMSFSASAATLYVLSGSTVEELTVDATGISAATALATLSQQATGLQYDNGALYLSSGQVLSASTGQLQGTFYSSATTPASGQMVSDSNLGRAFTVTSSFGINTEEVLAFDESTYNLLGSIELNGVGEAGYGSSIEKIVRWGQNGLAANASPGPFTTASQLFLLQSPLVKDLSSSPADLAVSLTAPAAAATGTSGSWVATITNQGPNASEGATVAISLDPSLVIAGVQASAGSCGTGATFSCDLGTLASGTSATVTVNATPTQAGTLTGTASVASISYDPAPDNDRSTASTTVTGGIYGAVPAISAIAPNLVQAGSDDLTLTVSGAGFNADSTVNLGTTALATTFVGSGQLTATVPAALVAGYGWAPVTVTNPSPGGGVSGISPLTIYQLVNVPATALLFDPYGQQLYATLPGSAANIAGNSVVSIDPVTGQAGTPVLVGSQPSVMAESGDGDYLYIGLMGADSLARYSLLSQSVTDTIPLTQGSPATGVAAAALGVMPGSDNTLVIQLATGGGFGIFDVNGGSGSLRPNLAGYGESPVFGDASHVYAYDGETTAAEFYRFSVDANGLTEIDGTTLEGMGGFGADFQVANGLVYGLGGGIINPSTTPPSQIATLSLFDFYNSGSTPEGTGLAADPSLGKEFLILENLAGSSAFGLVRYDLGTYLPEAVMDLPSGFSTSSGWTMVRWGSDGLALLGSSENYATDQTTTALILLRGPFVAPQELGTATAATLTGSSATAISHGSDNTLLTLTGTNLLPGVAVTWNGSYRTTTIVDSTHVTAAIPASDLAAAGSASVAATNPGAPASNALTVTIN